MRNHARSLQVSQWETRKSVREWGGMKTGVDLGWGDHEIRFEAPTATRYSYKLKDASRIGSQTHMSAVNGPKDIVAYH